MTPNSGRDGTGEEVRHRLDAERRTVAADVLPGRTRIRDAKRPYCLGTVAYVGEVAGYDGLYWGIVWDDPTRGRHDGSVADPATGFLRRYFQTPRNQPTAGSFVRPALVDAGRGLTRSVILERYRNCKRQDKNKSVLRLGSGNDGEQEEDQHLLEDEKQEQHVVSTVMGKTKPIVMVGTEKILRQQRWDKLDHMSLRWMGLCGVAAASGGEEFRDVRHLSHLDLAGNLFSDWTVLPQLLEAFPNLTRLSLAKNRMDDDTAVAIGWATANTGGSGSNSRTGRYPNLTHLNLRDCGIGSFSTIAVIARILPNLRELCCAYSQIVSDVVEATAPPRETLLSNLRSLDVTSCGFGTPMQLVALAAHCPGLESLSLNDNPLSSCPTSECWPHLRELQLDGTQFRDWESLRPLLELRHLEGLRFSCPLAAAGEGRTSNNSNAARMHWIAAVPSLRRYQSSSVTDRKEGEQQYVLKVAALSSKLQNESAAEGLLVPEDERYRELMETYADLVERRRAANDATGGSAGGGDGGDLLFLSMVTVTIRSFCASSCTMPPLVRKLPLRLTVGRLKALCARHFDLDADLQHLQWRSSSDRGAFPVDLLQGGDGYDDDDDESATLQDCGLVDGAEILVKERELHPSPSSSSSRQQLQQRRRDDKATLLRRIREQEEERFDLDRRKAAAAGAGGGVGIGGGTATIGIARTTESIAPTPVTDATPGADRRSGDDGQ